MHSNAISNNFNSQTRPGDLVKNWMGKTCSAPLVNIYTSRSRDREAF